MGKLEADLVPLTDFVSVKVPGAASTKQSIKAFVESKGITFAKGAGFYQLSKPEVIQLNKEILVQRISTPTHLITGKSVRSVLNIDDDNNKSLGGKFMIDEEILKEFKVFIQSTSYNRNLVGGTTFLYKKDVVDGGNTIGAAKRTPASSAPAGPAAKVPRVLPPASVASTPAPATFGSARAPVAPGGLTQIEVVFSFDTTGSMYPCLSTVRTVIKQTLTKLTDNIPSIRIGIVAHGDYDALYDIKAANNYKLCGKDQLDELIKFVNEAAPSGGYTYHECYELSLREVRNKFDWTDGANKSLILIGDSPPHEPSEAINKEKIDWRQEAKLLKDKGIKVYAVQCLDHYEATFFWQTVATLSSGYHLKLDQFSSIPDFLTAVCFHTNDAVNETGALTRYEEEVSKAGRMVLNLRRLFDQLQGREVSTVSAATAAASASGLVPVSPSRFQVLLVDADQPIKQFAEARGLIFKAGKGFYQFTKPEAVSDKKEIVLMDKTTGEFYTGWAAAREFSGIEAGRPGKQQPKDSDKYIVFIQSTSYNRKLIAGQQFLYEVDTSQ